MYISRNEELSLLIKLSYCSWFKKFWLFITFYELYLITAPYPVYHRGRSCRSRDQGQSAEWRGHAVVHWPPPALTARNKSCSECCLHGILWTDPAKEKTGRIKINSTVTSIKFSSEFVAAYMTWNMLKIPYRSTVVIRLQSTLSPMNTIILYTYLISF